MKKKQLAFLLLIGLLTISVLLPHSLVASESYKAVSIVLQGKIIQLYPPFEIIKTMMYRDGGTIAIVIEDGKGNALPFCLDGRIKRPSKIRHLYIEATHPSNAGAQQVPAGSDTEKFILKILKSAAIDESTPHIRQELVATVIEELENR